MEFSTLIVLVIAIFIIIYKVKTWNDVTVTPAEEEIKETVVEYKVDEVDQTVEEEIKSAPKEEITTKPEKEAKEKAKSEKPKKPKAAKKEPTSKAGFKKTLKAGQAKNIVLKDAVSNTLGSQKVFSVASQPKRGVATLVTLVDAHTKDDRAVGLVYEKSKDGVSIVKSFDVKMQANGSFKVSTSFSKALSVKVADMKDESIEATHFVVNDDESVVVSEVELTLK